MRKLNDVVTLWDVQGAELSDVLTAMAVQAKFIEGESNLYCIDVRVEMDDSGWRGFLTTGASEAMTIPIP